MFNLPVFGMSELELLKKYFEKNHAFRTGAYQVKMGGYIDDNFGGYQDRFAASAWRSYSVFGADTAVKAGDFISANAGPETILWSYGCGGGTDSSAGGVARSSQLAGNPIYAVFTTLFGSYHGDYNTRNNLMRSALASQPRALTCSWSGRPHWYMHHMGLGESFGYSTLISQNNTSIIGGALGTYAPNVTFNGTNASLVSIGDRGVHIALLGDPTLRAVMKPIAPVTTLSARYEFPNTIKLQWSQPNSEVTAYMVYRRRGAQVANQLLTPRPITSLEFIDSLVYEGPVTYQVQSCVLRKTASGTYYDIGKPAEAVVASTNVAEESSVNSPMIQLDVYPNPLTNQAQIKINLSHPGTLTATLMSLTGSVIWQASLPDCMAGEHNLGMELQDNGSSLAAGRYLLTVQTGLAVTTTLLTILR
jgi:hypothetical protein